MRRAGLFVAAMWSSAAFAHAGHEDAGRVAANDILIGGVIAGLLALFAVGWSRMPRRRSGEPVMPRWRAALFFGGMLALAAALLPPFDELADAYFSAHMAQHLVLLVVAPPMLAASQAQLVMLHAFALPTRRRVGRAISGVPGFSFVSHHASTIWFVVLSSIAVLWFWHFPPVYEAARRNEALHDAEHLLFLVTELAFWRVILFRREAELSRGGAALILVGMSIQGGLLAALITFARQSIYPSYGVGASSIADQALGGVMMWVIAGIVYLGAFAILFVRAMSANGRRVRKPGTRIPELQGAR